MTSSFASENVNYAQSDNNASEVSSTDDGVDEILASDMESQAKVNQLDAVSDGSEDKLSDTPGTFNELMSVVYTIDEYVELNRNYTRVDNRDTYSIPIEHKLTIEGNGYTIDGNSIGTYTNIFNVKTSSKVVFNNIIFKHATDSAVKFSRTANFEFNNCTFIDNSAAPSGGAIKIESVSKGDFVGCKFINNSATEHGGAIEFSDRVANVSYTNVEFENNYVYSTIEKGEVYGGAISYSKSKYVPANLSYTNVNFKNNYVNGSVPSNILGVFYEGGAISYQKGGINVSYTNCNFTNNSAVFRGGAIFITSANAAMCRNNYYTNVNFIENKIDAHSNNIGAGGHAAALYIGPDGSDIIFTNVNFDRNVIIADHTGRSYENSIYKGVAICSFNPLIRTKFYNVNFTNNYFDMPYDYLYHGGAAFFERMEGDFIDCNIMNNSAEYGGAFVFRSGPTIGNFTNTVFENNTATKDGGAIFIYELFYGNSYLITNNVNFTHNTAGENGGAVYISKNTDDSRDFFIQVNVNNTNFENNRAANGSSIYNDKSNKKGNISISNSEFLNNQANASITINYDKFYQKGNLTVVLGDNYINAIYTKKDIKFTNVTYFEYENNIYNTDDVTPVWSNLKENLTVTLQFLDENGEIVDEQIIKTDSNGYANFSYVGGDGVVSIKATFDEDEYYIGENDVDIKWGDFEILRSFVIKADKNGVIDLKRNYTYTLGMDTITEGVIIDKNVTIDGHGFTVDALFISRIFNIRADNVVLKNINFVHGNSTVYDYGGAIFANNVSNIQIINCGFENCTALNGGSIYINGTDNSITGCNFTENLGLISLDQVTNYKYHRWGQDYTYEEIYNPVALSPLTQCGGAIYIRGNGVNITNSKFKNINTHVGGAIYSDNVTNAVIDGCDFKNCSAEFGGAISLTGESNHILNSNFTNNSIEYSVFVTEVLYQSRSHLQNPPWLNHYETRYDYLSKNAAAIYLGGSNSSVEGCEFNNLLALNNAGAVYINASNISIRNSVFKNTKAAKYGLALVWEGEYGNLINCTFEDIKIDYDTNFPNQFDGSQTHVSVIPLISGEPGVYGGIVFWLGNHGHIKDSNFTKNTVNKALPQITTSEGYYNLYYGVSAIYVYSDADTVNIQTGERNPDSLKHGFNVTVEDCNFMNNHDYLSTILWSGANGTLLNSNFYKNENDYGSTVLWTGENATIITANFTENRGNYGGAVTIQGDNAAVINSSFAENHGVYGGAIANRGINTKIINSSFNYNNANFAGAIMILGAGFKSDDETLINNYLEKYSANVLVDNCIFVGNWAEQGGAVLTNGYKTQIKDSRFYNNTAELGGALMVAGFYETIINSIFDNNSAFAGGAITVGGYGWNNFESYIIKSNSTAIKNSTFTNNIAEIAGAVLWLTDNGTVTDNTIFEQNIVNDTYNRIAPILFIHDSHEEYSERVCDSLLYDYDIDAVNLRGNGAGIVWLGADGTVNNTTFKNNKAYSFKTFIFHYMGEEIEYPIEIQGEWDDSYYEYCLRMAEEDIRQKYNYVSLQGDSIETSAATGETTVKYYFYAYNKTVETNVLNSSAGAIFWLGDNGLINDSIFQYNSAHTGGAVYQNNTLLRISNSKFLENKANSTELKVVNGTNILNITLMGMENHLNAIYSENGNVEFDNVDYWNGNIVNTKNVQDNTFTNESGQKIIVEIYKNDVLTASVSRLTSADGQLSIDFRGILESGEYSYIAYHLDDNYYTYIKQTGNLIVDSNIINVNLTVEVENICYGQNATVKVTLKDVNGNNVTNVTVNVTINGTPYSINITNGTGSRNISGLAAGTNYLANATFKGNAQYRSANATDLFNVTKVNSTLTVNNITFVYGGSNTTVIDYTGATNVTANVIGHPEATVIIGNKNITVSGLGAGNYTLNVTTQPDNNHTAVTKLVNITVYKANSSVVINPIVNVTYGNQTVINFTVVNATEVTWNITDKDGSVVATGKGLNNITGKFAAGNYTITIRNAGTVNITGSSAEMNFTVFKANSSVVIDTIVNVTYGNQTVINFTVVNATEVTWNITDKDGSVVATGKGLNNITGKFAAGNYTITIRNAGTVNITGSSAEMNFTVYKAGSSVVINPIAKVTYGNETKINFTVVNATEVTWNITDKDGNVVATGNDLNNITKTLAAGNYTITIANADNQNYTGDIKSADFTVNKAPATLDVNDITFIEGDSGSSPITYTGESEVVGVIVDYKDAVVKIENNTITVSGLPESNYALNVTVYPDENHTGISKVVNVTVTKKSEDKMNVTSDSPVEGENATVTVNLPENTTGNVTVTLNNGSKYNATVKNGTASVNVPNLPAGDNNVTVTYSDDNGNSQSTTATIHVKKILIDASDMKRGWDSPYDYQAKLIDEDGKAIAGKTLTFTVNGKQYNATTDSNGIAKLTASKLAVGKYKITTAFPANGANTTKDLEIVKRLVENKDLTKDYLSSKHYTVRAIGDDGNPVGAGVVVTITTHGVTYKEKTDKNGYATLLIRLIPGKYTIKSTYHKYSVTNKLKVKQTLKLVKKTVKVKKGKKIVLKAKLKWSNGKAIKGKVIKFKFKGKTYKAKTNKKGIAKVTIKKKSVLKKLKKGKTYKYYGIYVKNKVKGKVKIKK